MFESHFMKLSDENMFECLSPLIPIVLESFKNIVAETILLTKIFNVEVRPYFGVHQKFIWMDGSVVMKWRCMTRCVVWDVDMNDRS
jgi:hypothetical protein